VQLLAPHVRGDASFAAAEQLLRRFSFDSARLGAVEVMAPRWLTLPADDRSRLATTFASEAPRAQALGLLMK
jgi:hypothetical protein